jgi:hypothetical protein
MLKFWETRLYIYKRIIIHGILYTNVVMVQKKLMNWPL